MSINNISNIMNNRIRFSGMASGLDTDSLVQQLMQVERTKVDKLWQQKQLKEWKRDNYREIISLVRGFRDEYFDVLNPSKNMRSATAFSAFNTTYDGETSSTYFSATAGVTAKAGTYTISNIVTATAEKVSSSAALAGAIIGTDIASFSINEASANNKISITLNGTSKEITVTDNPAGIDALVLDLQNKIDTAFGSSKITVGKDGATNKLTFSSVSATSTLSIGAVTSNGGFAALGLNGVNISNRISVSAYLYDIKDNFGTGNSLNVTADPNDTDISFTINGQTFSFNSATTSLSEIMSTVNNNTTANVKMEYSELYDKITITSKTLGIASDVQIADVTGNLLTGSLRLTVTTAGRDARITYNDNSGTGDQTITRATNSFTVDGIVFELKKDTAGPIELGVVTDTSKILDLVKGFVNKYNELISKINSELGEERNRSYLPLTDEQKDSMKEEDIKKWEEKAKSGLLKGDSLVNAVVSNMRTALYDNIYTDASNEATKLTQSLFTIGITTSTYYGDKGKLIIDETKLKEAITNNTDKVVQLFTKDDSGITYNDAINDSAKRAERYKESGLAIRLYDIIQDSIRTTRDNDGKKGTLLEKAGMIGDISEFTSLMYNEIQDYDSRIARLNNKLIDKENRYYQKFTTLERMLSQMNSQGSWLSSQMGQG